jgi:KEOPS complex subunit Cgi121
VENMLSYRISGSETFVSITGVKGVDVKDINKTLTQLDEHANGIMYQLFDADYIAGPNHLYHAAVNAKYALNNGLNISNNISIETLLYAACESQINRAIKTLGVSEKTRNLAVTVFSVIENDPLTNEIAQSLGEIEDSVLAVTSEKYESLVNLFDITEEAMKTMGKEPYDALTGLITEKGALLSLRR